MNGSTATDGSHTNGSINGNGVHSTKLNRAEEMDDLLSAVKDLVIPFIKAADDAAGQKHTGQTYRTQSGEPHNVLVDYMRPEELAGRMKLSLPVEGRGKEGLLEVIQKMLKYSVNTWEQGFLDKLFSTNTPIHVYQVAPALTVVEKTTAKALANMYGFTGPNAGGINCQGGSASNLTSLVVARNTLFPECRTNGNAGHDFVIFTSQHGHYSVEKAAMILGMGTSSVRAVPVDDEGSLKPELLAEMVVAAKAEGKTPLYVNATAGTTVRGSFEPLEAISAICKEHGLWMHVDASFGGPVIFSRKHSHKMRGSHLADSLTVNPHKMMNVPSTCSYLLGPDMAIFNRANRTAAGYLFHTGDEDSNEIWDMADLTLQCGRRADSLKLALAWQYYGSAGFERRVDHAFDMAELLFNAVREASTLHLVSPVLPSCLQVCFYYAPPGQAVSDDAATNTAMTAAIAQDLIPRGFMVDYAPGDKGSFFRVVVNGFTQPDTIHGLIKATEEIGKEKFA
ncbi:glutamate decarboxylase [Geosmithia morbida]|uniref:Glutamate decarboxylase n=1 Tax=Geosmithia morbida TaxID=1094350 RepID=A0A9P4Z275_9HYPO|nr:glutamate decarboxylase [Geosmithia morbida]KAF4126069.1 glutamate decarboxylase [Geosmithia morbida]